MPTRSPSRACRGCRTTITSGTHCPSCRPAHNARRKRPGYDRQERERRAQAVLDHVAVHGWWCPGWGPYPAHSTLPGELSADHVTAVDGHPEREGGPLEVLCTFCNQKKAARVT
jgi:hypothetical protein